MVTLGAFLMVLGVTVARESLRLHWIDVESLYDVHAAALTRGGLIVFAVFLLVNAAVIGWCFFLVRRERISPPSAVLRLSAT